MKTTDLIFGMPLILLGMFIMGGFWYIVGTPFWFYLMASMCSPLLYLAILLEKDEKLEAKEKGERY